MPGHQRADLLDDTLVARLGERIAPRDDRRNVSLAGQRPAKGLQHTGHADEVVLIVIQGPSERRMQVSRRRTSAFDVLPSRTPFDICHSPNYAWQATFNRSTCLPQRSIAALIGIRPRLFIHTGIILELHELF